MFMKLPFIEHIGIGLHITDEAIRWVELSRIRDQVKIRSMHTEKIEEGDVKSGLLNLIERVNPSWKYVTVNLDPGYVRQKLIEAPDAEDHEYLEIWLREQKEAMVPAGLNREDFVIGHHFTGHPEEEQQCLLLITRKEVVEERIKLLGSVGLKPSIITTGDLETGYAFIFDQEFTEGESCLIKIFEDYSSLHFYQEGVLNNIIELSNREISVSEIFEEAEALLATEGLVSDRQSKRKLYTIISETYGTAGSIGKFSGNAEKKIPTGKPLAHLKPGNNQPGSDLSVAAGMAVKQLYPALDTINFLDDQHRANIREDIQKKDALNTGLVSGGCVVLLFTVLMIAQFVLGPKLNKSQQQLALLDDHLTAVTEAGEKVTDLEQRVNQARELVGERTAMAGLLELIGRSVPQRVWLNEVTINETERAGEAALHGLAYNDALVASLMERLEKEKRVSSVRLIFSEMVASEDVYDSSDIDQSSFVQFEVRMFINAISLEPGGS